MMKNYIRIENITEGRDTRPELEIEFSAQPIILARSFCRYPNSRRRSRMRFMLLPPFLAKLYNAELQK